MSEQEQSNTKPITSPDPTVLMFAEPKAERGGVPIAAWVAAGFVVLVLFGVLLGSGHRPAPVGSKVLPLDAYATQMPISKLEMSESTSLSGGKSTYIDGVVTNTGAKTVTGATVQVLFANDEGMPPQVETLALTPIRAREPYVDTQTFSAAPLKPGEAREFRLVFESIGTNWNMQVPQIHITQVDAR